jgi:hypothetical protein
MKLRATVTIDLEVEDLKAAGTFQSVLEEHVKALREAIEGSHTIQEVDFDLSERRAVTSRKRGG